MGILTVHPESTDQETAIRIFLDALHVSYISSEIDETDYLNSSKVMRARLEMAAEQEKNNEGVTITLDDIWK